MRTETTAYRIQRAQWVTKPSAFVRAFFVRNAGSPTEYPFSRDFAAFDVLAPTTPKLVCIKDLRLGTHAADPVAGRSSIGTMEVDLGDQRGEILKQIADPAAPLRTAILATGTPTVIEVDGAIRYPSVGHVTIDAEDFRYTGVDTVADTLTGITRAARGTTAAAHVVASLVRNGEPLRRGVRLTLFLGYQPMDEADYGPGPGYTKMEIQSVASKDTNLTWTLRCSDIQRFTKRKIFEVATKENPATLGPGHPITLGLQVLMSTGQGTNGPYDVLVRENGCGVPMALIDTAAFESISGTLSAIIPGIQASFSEIEPQDGKEWFETQILRPLMILPDVNQSGQYTGRLIAAPMFARTGLMSGAFRAA
jgi:hypothetical protein